MQWASSCHGPPWPENTAYDLGGYFTTAPVERRLVYLKGLARNAFATGQRSSAA